MKFRYYGAVEKFSINKNIDNEPLDINVEGSFEDLANSLCRLEYKSVSKTVA